MSVDLHRTYGISSPDLRFCFHFKILKGMSPPDDFVSTNVEITSRIYLGVIGWKEKDLTIMYLLLIFSMLGWFLYFLTILLLGSGSFKEPDESDHLSNPRHDVMDLK